MSTSMKSKRISPGLYEVTVGTRRFHVEDIQRASDGEVLPGWMLYEIKGDEDAREFWNDFSTKRAAMNAIQKGVEE